MRDDPRSAEKSKHYREGTAPPRQTQSFDTKDTKDTEDTEDTEEKLIPY